jgi:hypothetical protein
VRCGVVGLDENMQILLYIIIIKNYIINNESDKSKILNLRMTARAFTVFV